MVSIYIRTWHSPTPAPRTNTHTHTHKQTYITAIKSCRNYLKERPGLNERPLRRSLEETCVWEYKEI